MFKGLVFSGSALLIHLSVPDHFAEVESVSSKFFFQHFGSLLSTGFTMLFQEGMLDFVAGMTGFYQIQPFLPGNLFGGSHDFHRVSVFQWNFQLGDGSVGFGANDPVADSGMDRVGKINRRRSTGKFEDIPFGSSDKNFVGIEFKPRLKI